MKCLIQTAYFHKTSLIHIMTKKNYKLSTKTRSNVVNQYGLFTTFCVFAYAHNDKFTQKYTQTQTIEKEQQWK